MCPPYKHGLMWSDMKMFSRTKLDGVLDSSYNSWKMPEAGRKFVERKFSFAFGCFLGHTTVYIGVKFLVTSFGSES